MAKKELTIKQQLFIKEYLIDFNGSRAAISAGYSKNCAGIQAFENLKKPNIQKALSQGIVKHIDKVEITIDYVLKAIKDIVEKEKAKDSDKLKGLDMLGKYLKLWVENQINIQVNYIDLVKKDLTNATHCPVCGHKFED